MTRVGSKAQYLPNFLRTRIAIWRLHCCVVLASTKGDTRFGPHKTDQQWNELLAISALD